MLEWFVMTDIKFIYRIRNQAGKPQSVGPVKSTELPFTRSNLSMSQIYISKLPSVLLVH